MTRSVEQMLMRERENRIMANLPYRRPDEHGGVTVKRLAFDLNITESKVRTALAHLMVACTTVREQWGYARLDDEMDRHRRTKLYAIVRKP